MKIFQTFLISLLAIMYSCTGKAQEALSVDEFTAHLPQPPATLQLALAKPTPDVEMLLATCSGKVKKGSDEAYKPLYAYFLKNLESGAANSNAYSAAERTLYRDYSSSTKGLSSDNQYLQFQLLVAGRPLLSSGLLSWGVASKFSGAEKDWYLQAISLEKMIDHTLPKSNALVAKLDFGGQDPALNAIHETFNKEFAALPKLNVKTAEGFTLEVEDPNKAIAAYKIYGRKRHEHFARVYETRFAKWQVQFQRLSAIAEKLQSLSAQPSTRTPAGVVLLSDLQARVWNAATHLYSATERLWQDILIAQAGQNQVEEAIKIYSGYKASL
ncbi:hypothetical protein ACX0G7_22345 [Flavitalea antarctica]